MFFKMGMGGHLRFKGQDVSKSKNDHFIGFVTLKIVEFSILYLHLYAHVLLSSKVIVFYVFKMEMGSHLEFRGQDVSKSKKKHFIGFATPKIVEFSVLYLHLNVYILLSSKKVITLFFKIVMAALLDLEF